MIPLSVKHKNAKYKRNSYYDTGNRIRYFHDCRYTKVYYAIEGFLLLMRFNSFCVSFQSPGCQFAYILKLGFMQHQLRTTHDNDFSNSD
jgi:hypothetical protein